MRLSEQTNKFLTWMAAFRGASADTTTTYGVSFAQFQAFVVGQQGGTDDMRHFTADNVQAFAEYLVGQGIKPITARQRLVALASFAKWAMRQKVGAKYLLAENPMDRVERPRKGTPKSSFLYPHEAKALLEVQAAPHEALARDLFFDTGLRVSELAHANVQDVWQPDAERRMLRVRLKGGRERNVPLGAEMVSRIQDALLARNLPPAEAPLLVNSEGQRWRRSSLTEMIARLGKRAGITRVRIGPHMIRHTYNVVADQVAGLGVTVRAALLNHAGTGSLQKYDHLMAGDTASARDAVRAAMREYTK